MICDSCLYAFEPCCIVISLLLWSFVIRRCHMHAVRRCSLLLQMSHVVWSVCLSVYRHTDVLCKIGCTYQDVVWGADSCVQWTIC